LGLALQNSSPIPQNSSLFFDLIFLIKSVRPTSHLKSIEKTIREENLKTLFFNKKTNLHCFLILRFSEINNSEHKIDAIFIKLREKFGRWLKKPLLLSSNEGLKNTYNKPYYEHLLAILFHYKGENFDSLDYTLMEYKRDISNEIVSNWIDRIIEPQRFSRTGYLMQKAYQAHSLEKDLGRKEDSNYTEKERNNSDLAYASIKAKYEKTPNKSLILDKENRK